MTSSPLKRKRSAVDDSDPDWEPSVGESKTLEYLNRQDQVSPPPPKVAKLTRRQTVKGLGDDAEQSNPQDHQASILVTGGVYDTVMSVQDMETLNPNELAAHLSQAAASSSGSITIGLRLAQIMLIEVLGDKLKDSEQVKAAAYKKTFVGLLPAYRKELAVITNLLRLHKFDDSIVSALCRTKSVAIAAHIGALAHWPTKQLVRVCDRVVLDGMTPIVLGRMVRSAASAQGPDELFGTSSADTRAANAASAPKKSCLTKTSTNSDNESPKSGRKHVKWGSSAPPLTPEGGLPSPLDPPVGGTMTPRVRPTSPPPKPVAAADPDETDEERHPEETDLDKSVFGQSSLWQTMVIESSYPFQIHLNQDHESKAVESKAVESKVESKVEKKKEKSKVEKEEEERKVEKEEKKEESKVEKKKEEKKVEKKEEKKVEKKEEPKAAQAERPVEKRVENKTTSSQVDWNAVFAGSTADSAHAIIVHFLHSVGAQPQNAQRLRHCEDPLYELQLLARQMTGRR